MATTSFGKKPAAANSWEEAFSGATYSKISIRQSLEQGPVAVAVASAQPAIGSSDYFIADGSEPSDLDLATGDKVWIRAIPGRKVGVLRGFAKTVA